HLGSVAAVKDAAARLLGIPADGLTPVPAIVSPPATYVNYATGQEVMFADVDLVARVVGGRPAGLHKAYPGTLGACTGVAARMEGTTVNAVTRRDRRDPDQITIGHTSGVMPVSVRVAHAGEQWVVEEATYERTARRLAEGTAFVRSSAVTSHTSKR
ncbi:MAG: PrpF domain-containing protein, partial [Acidimicrobiia bacterium]